MKTIEQKKKLMAYAIYRWVRKVYTEDDSLFKDELNFVIETVKNVAEEGTIEFNIVFSRDWRINPISLADARTLACCFVENYKGGYKYFDRIFTETYRELGHKQIKKLYGLVPIQKDEKGNFIETETIFYTKAGIIFQLLEHKYEYQSTINESKWFPITADNVDSLVEDNTMVHWIRRIKTDLESLLADGDKDYIIAIRDICVFDAPQGPDEITIL